MSTPDSPIKPSERVVLTPTEFAATFGRHYSWDYRQIDAGNGGQLRYDAPVVELDQPCPFETRKTWADVIQKLPTEERPQIVVAFDRQGGLHEVIGRKEAGEAARSLDLAVPSETRSELSPAAIQQRKAMRDAREKHERTIRAVDLAISGVIEKQAKAKDTKALFRLLRLLVMKEANFDTERRVAKRHGFTTPKKDGDPLPVCRSLFGQRKIHFRIAGTRRRYRLPRSRKPPSLVCTHCPGLSSDGKGYGPSFAREKRRSKKWGEFRADLRLAVFIMGLPPGTERASPASIMSKSRKKTQSDSRRSRRPRREDGDAKKARPPRHHCFQGR